MSNSNLDGEDDDFLTLRLCPPPSSPSSKSSADFTSSSQTLEPRPPVEDEQRQLPNNTATYSWGFDDALALCLQSAFPPQLETAQVSSSSTEPPLVRLHPPPTPDQIPPPPAPAPTSRVQPKLRSRWISEFVPQPFPWATNRRATVHSVDYLLSNQITTIQGEVRCKFCDRQYMMECDLKEKIKELSQVIRENIGNFHHERAPPAWLHPSLPTCRYCGVGTVRPVIGKKKAINWLFLLLSQTLGCCTMKHLKYFRKHARSQMGGTKRSLLYLTYQELWRQLLPKSSFT